ncbi:hypothetical protein SBI_04404 [Streptomyces bingchenggensis BCW-1]|uniref:DUF1963 domain-containing protein n=2 Tax=Streptomyces TaxID=1883 RepID=D7BVC3_STRBB|nr:MULTISPECIES: YwqG family protein [Streptomyces]ADI07524.1 hypothetical protein SBI_04404 [Streptomyces bingchenggensis BCW-1]
MLSLPLLSELAHERLPSGLADRFCSLLEPRGQILSAARPGDEHVGVLGGEPLLPEGVEWPVWEGHGPLSFIAALDCGRHFQDAVWNLRRVRHQVGGAPDGVQGEVEYEVADFPDDWDLDEFNPDNPHFDDILAEAARWRLLLQIASDDEAGMLWGDAGALYWLIDPEDLAAGRFDQARFTWQCH